jgi:hypothetical protein
VSSTELMLGQTILGSQLKDLRSVLAYLRGRRELDAERMAVWGDSFAPAQADDVPYAVPRGTGDEPEPCEPAAPLLALLGGLYEDDLAAVVFARGGLASFESLLETPFVYVPHDTLIPAALTVSETSDIAAAIAPRPLWIGPLVNGVNREVHAPPGEAELQRVRESYRAQGSAERLRLSLASFDDAALADWLSQALGQR